MRHVAIALIASASLGYAASRSAGSAAEFVARTQPMWSPNGRRILFVGGDYPDVRLYVVSADGTNLKRLSTGAPPYEDPAWSPDGSKIVFSAKRDQAWQLFIMNADGTNERALVTTSRKADDPSRGVWSPDGKTIAYRKQTEIFVINADGTGDRPLANQVGTSPDWSHDGKHIAFHSGRDGNLEVYVVNADGSLPVRLTTDPAQDVGPRWSPDDSKILLQSARMGGFPHWRLFVMKADGSDQHAIGDGQGRDMAGDWSPSGDRIVFASIRNGMTKHDLYVMKADGSSVERLLTDAPLP